MGKNDQMRAVTLRSVTNLTVYWYLEIMTIY